MSNLLLIITLILFFSKAIKNANVGVSYILSVSTFASLFYPPGHSEPLFAVGSYNIFFIDIISVLFYYGAVVKIFTNKSYKPLKFFPFKIYFILLHVYILVSFLINGSTAIVYSRANILFISATLFFASFCFEDYDVKKIYKIFTFYILILIIISSLRWIGIIPLPEYYKEILSIGYAQKYNAYRFLNAFQGLDLVIFLFITFYLWSKNFSINNLNLVLSIFSFLTILIIQQRTIWVILIFSFLLLILNLKLTKIIKISIPIIIGLVILIFILKTNQFIYNIFYDAIFKTVLNNPENSTGGGRFFQAVFLFNTQLFHNKLLFGELFGTDITAKINNIWVNFSIHMYHYSILFYGGFLLFIPYVWFKFSLLVKVRKMREFNKLFYLISSLLFYILLFNIILEFTTSPSLNAGFYYGFAITFIIAIKSHEKLSLQNKEEY